MRDVHGNWFLSDLLFETEKEAEEEAAFIIEYDFVHSVQIIKNDKETIKKFKTYIN
jgi:hypothetical protein